MPHLFYKSDGFLDGIDEIGLVWREGLEAVEDVSLTGVLQGYLERLDGIIPGILGIPSLLDRPLVRRTVDEDFSSDVSAEVDEGFDIFLSLDPDIFIGVIDVEPFGFDKKPVKADDLNPVILCGAADCISP